MPQLDLVTFADQIYYVYLFFIFQYILVSTVIVPLIYQVLATKHLFYKTVKNELKIASIFLFTSLYLLTALEVSFENKIN